MGADEAKSLRDMRSDVAGIEQVSETTSPIMESPSPDDKVFAEFEGRLVAMTRDETCRAIQLVEVYPWACSIRRLGKEEAYNLGLGELLPFNEIFWLFSIIEKGPDPENSGRLIGCKNPLKLQAETVVTNEGYVCDAAVREIKEEIGLAKPVWERIAGKDDGTANSKTNRLPTRSSKDLKKAKIEQKALKHILRESSGVYAILTDKFPFLCANRENLLPVYILQGFGKCPKSFDLQRFSWKTTYISRGYLNLCTLFIVTLPVALTVLYAIWCFMYRMKPATGQDFEITADLMSQMLEELNANDSV
ncbi:hypothetical protein P8452_65511 [Trifolium repens]|nr:hypothetical protein P8452_65511 [Trifolium repens]